jgi:CheY-like chemotaxis protein
MLAVTAMAGEEHRERTAAAGFHRHLVKPVAPSLLLAELAAAWEEVLAAHVLATAPINEPAMPVG